ncbi:hypothetical protein RCL1_008266 [Eukaryota sp. TZLM3-RCL]
MKTLSVLEATSHNPYLNLAVETFLLQNGHKNQHTLYLWDNEPTVVIGKHQHTLSECDLPVMTADKVNLARRVSGGGAVYQDSQCPLFTFLSPSSDFSKDRNNSIILSALKRFGINAETSGRNDILVNGLKVSGSAFKVGPSHSFHHGTVLVDVNLDNLGKYLSPSQSKLQSKGVASVRSRVENLKTFESSMTSANIKTAIVDEFIKHHKVNRLNVSHSDASSLERDPRVQEIYQKFKSREWILGNNPTCNIMVNERFHWGGVDIRFNVSEHRIKDVHLYSDSMFVEVIDKLKEALDSCEFSRDAVLSLKSNFKETPPEQLQCVTDVLNLVVHNIV